MSVSYQELKRLRPAALQQASTALSGAVTKLATEHTQYKVRVVRPLKARHGWRGGGQPDAAAVAEINGLAMDTTRLRAAAGAAAYMYACAGFTVAQVYLAALLKKIKNDQMHVDAHGNVSANDAPVGDDGGPGSTSAKVLKYQADMGKILRFAGKVDAHAARQLNTSHEPPLTTLTNKPGLLEQARADNTDAARDAKAAVDLLEKLGEQANDLPDLRGLDIDLPSYGVQLPPGAPASAELGALLIKTALEGAVGGALLGLALGPETDGVSVAGGAASVVVLSAVAAAGAALITAAGISLSRVHVYQTSGGGIAKTGGPDKNLDDLLQRAERVENQAKPGYQGPPELRVTDKQFGTKIGKHAEDFGRNPKSAEDREWLRRHIEDIGDAPDERRQGPWRGGCRDYLFFRKGADVVVAKPDGTFVTVLEGGQFNRWFLGATKIG